MDQNVIPFLMVIGMGIGVILISRALDILWAQVIPIRFFYYIIRAPGVVVHELSHVFGCVIMGAKIKKVVLFSEEGGSVTYSRPKIPYLGDLVIGTAPLFCLPLVLAGFTWIFSTYLGCEFPPFLQGVNSTDELFLLAAGIIGMFVQNLVVVFNPWFLLYLYITLTLVLSVAPSMQDIKNAAIGICIISLAGYTDPLECHPPCGEFSRGDYPSREHRFLSRSYFWDYRAAHFLSSGDPVYTQKFLTGPAVAIRSVLIDPETQFFCVHDFRPARRK